MSNYFAPAKKRRYRGRRGVGPVAMGDSLSDAVSSVVGVVTDPYINEVTCHMAQLRQINSHQPVQPCPEVPYGQPGGIGLDKVAVALRGYVFAEQNPLVYPLIAAVVLGIPFLIGYRMGGG